MSQFKLINVKLDGPSKNECDHVKSLLLSRQKAEVLNSVRGEHRASPHCRVH